jgi:hypothetical protein
MKLTEEQCQALSKCLCDNFPEYAISFRCTSWNYDEGTFKFIDDEEGKLYEVTTKDIAKAIPKFFEGLNDKWFFYGVDQPQDGEDVDDIACMFDAIAMDGLLQLAIFNEIIYG